MPRMGLLLVNRRGPTREDGHSGVGLAFFLSLTVAAAYRMQPKLSTSLQEKITSLPYTSRLVGGGDQGAQRLEQAGERIDPIFRLVHDAESDTFAFQTASIRMARGPKILELVGTVHVGEPRYFHLLEDACLSGRDLVLFELVTSSQCVEAVESSVNGSVGGGERKRERPRYPLQATPQLRQFAKQHGLEPQMDCMELYRDGWFISDIVRERLTELQRERGEKTLESASSRLPIFQHIEEMAQIFWDGFRSRGRIMPKLLLPEGVVIIPLRMLRMVMWLAPCPEAQLLLIDWSRQYPPAGGLSKILRSMVGALVHGDLLTLRRLAFAQMLTSSQGTPQPDVLVGERNSKVVLDVEDAFADGASNVAVLYGGLHLQDMERKLKQHLGLGRTGLTWHTAWTMPGYTHSAGSAKQVLIIVLCVALPLLQLIVGAVDWSATIGEVATDFTRHTGAGYEEGVKQLGLYVLRHMYIYYGLTRWICEWEKSLFESAGWLKGDAVAKNKSGASK